MTTEANERRQTMLLAIIAFLLLGNTLAIVAGVFWVRSEVASLARDQGGPIASLEENLAMTRKMAQEVTDRQAALAAGLDEIARKTNFEMKGLQERRNQLGGLKRGPLDKFDQMIGLMQLMSDELAVMLKHISTSQGVLARSTRPGEAQKELLTKEAPETDAGTK